MFWNRVFGVWTWKENVLEKDDVGDEEEEAEEKEKGKCNLSPSKSLLDLASLNHSLLIQLNKTIITIQ